MNQAPKFELATWATEQAPGADVVLAGSATPALSIPELMELSTDPAQTAKALDLSSLKFGPSGPVGNAVLRERVAALYDKTISADDVIIANGTTGANLIVLESLLSAGDEVVCMYPCYGPLIDIPIALGCKVIHWRLEENWDADTAKLKSLVTSKTKMIVLNSPNNPTGVLLPLEVMEEIVAIAREQGIAVFADEIFRPLSHDFEPGDVRAPKSLVELSASYNKLVVTGSLSKAWGMSGVRIGWVVCRNAAFRAKMIDIRLLVLQAVSCVDEAIAAEALSDRCRPAILSKHLTIARKNLETLGKLALEHDKSIWMIRPQAGGTAFVRFLDPENGQPVDDMKFCHLLKQDCGILVAPGSLCFGSASAGDFKGFVRVHLTALPEAFERGMKQIAKFVESEAYAGLCV